VVVTRRWGAVLLDSWINFASSIVHAPDMSRSYAVTAYQRQESHHPSSVYAACWGGSLRQAKATTYAYDGAVPGSNAIQRRLLRVSKREGLGAL
jgi:hypothetical protein